MLTGDLTAYLSRLTGETLSPGQTFRLRSVQRAALTAWARRQQPPIQLHGLALAETSAEILLGAGSAAAPSPMPAPRTPAVSGGIGIDIEMVDALPTADDLRAHPFYQDNFTPAELAYCIRQRNVRASLCGLWAAKEAILKAGIVASPGTLRAIEVGHDDTARPTFPGCKLSISHTDIMAVAACIAEPAAAPAPAPAIAAAAPKQATPARLPRRLSYGLAAAACVVSAILGSTAALLLPV